MNELLQESYDENQALAEKLNARRASIQVVTRYAPSLAPESSAFARLTNYRAAPSDSGNGGTCGEVKWLSCSGVHWGKLATYFWRKLGFIKGTAQNLHVGYFYEPPSQQSD